MKPASEQRIQESQHPGRFVLEAIVAIHKSTNDKINVT